MDKSGYPFHYDLLKFMESRSSCRKFAPVDFEGWNKEVLIKAADSAPYASGGPRCRIHLLSPDIKLSEACFNQKHVKDASLAVLFAGEDPEAVLRSGHAKYIFDCSAACMCMDLMAVAMGYGTCWIGHFDPAKIRDVFNLHDDLIPVIILLVGEWDDE